MPINEMIPLASRAADLRGMPANLTAIQRTKLAMEEQPYRNALLQAQTAGTETRTRINQEALAEAERMKKLQGTMYTYNAIGNMLQIPEGPHRQRAYEALAGQMQALGYEAGALDDDLSDSALMEQLAALEPFIPREKTEQTATQQDFQYWQRLPEGTAAWEAFGKKAGFIVSDKDTLTAEKLQAEIDALADGNPDPEKSAEIESKLRKEVYDRSKDFELVDDAYRRIKASAEDPSPAGDLALIFNYMKVLDPGSTVREGEFANAESAGNVPSRIWGQYNKVVNGERLTDTQRADFLSRSEKLFKAAENKNIVLKAKYRKLADSYGVNTGNVVLTDGKVMVDGNGNRAIVYADGSFEEL